MSKVISELVNFIKSEARVVREFATTPKGVFETIYGMLKVARVSSRNIVKELMRAIGLEK